MKTNAALRVGALIQRVWASEKLDIGTWQVWSSAFEIEGNEAHIRTIRRLALLERYIWQLTDDGMGGPAAQHSLNRVRGLVCLSLTRAFEQWKSIRPQIDDGDLRCLMVIGALLPRNELLVEKSGLAELCELIDACLVALNAADLPPDAADIMRRYLRVLRLAVEEAEIMGVDAWRQEYRHGWHIINDEKEILKDAFKESDAEKTAGLRATLKALWEKAAHFAGALNDFKQLGENAIKLISGSSES